MDFREKAANFVLSNHDVAKALELLDNAENQVPDEVTVWEKFEYEPLENIIGYIDLIADMLKEAYEKGKSDAV